MEKSMEIVLHPLPKLLKYEKDHSCFLTCLQFVCCSTNRLCSLSSFTCGQGSTTVGVNGHILGAHNIKPEDINSLHIVKDIGKFPKLKNQDRYGVIFVQLKKGINIDSKKSCDFKNELKYQRHCAICY